MKAHSTKTLFSTLGVQLLLGSLLVAQTAAIPQHDDSGSHDATLAADVMQLRTKVQNLENQFNSLKAVDSMDGMSMEGKPDADAQMGMGMMKGKKMMEMGREAGMKTDGSVSKGMDGMDKMKGMGMMNMGGGSMTASSSEQSAAGMKMSDSGSSMGMMGMMKGMGAGSAMTIPSALPGFPGASHLYHIGATGFFLDHGEHLKLTSEQQVQLNRIKEGMMLGQATSERNIEEAEQQLWQLTAAGQPDAKAIEEKIDEIEELRGDQRLDFIRAVGEAAKVLSHEQHQALTGDHSPQGAQSDTPEDHTSH